MSVIKVNNFSMYLKRTTDCTVVLPDNIKSNQKLKCLWLYHGGSGNHKEWLYHAPLTDISNERNIAIILPNVNESCFVNMNIGDRYANYVGKELPSIIHKMFKCISDKRCDNYVSGLSNGGYGCLHTALTYPDKYCMVGAFSAGDKADSDFEDNGSLKSIQRIRLFGNGDIHNTDYCIIHLANKLVNKNVEKPVIFHACGGKDPWLDKNHIIRDYFLQHLNSYNYKYDELEEYGHEWKFWNIELIKFLDFAGITKL